MPAHVLSHKRPWADIDCASPIPAASRHSGSGRGDAKPTLVIALAPMDPWPESTKVAVVPWPRNERGALAGLKTTSYAENVVALAYAKRLGAGEALFADTRGRLSEGTGSNVFVVLGDRLVTPALTTGCLAGVTRALVLGGLRPPSRTARRGS